MSPNKRGTAARSPDKRVRVATHAPVIRACASAMPAPFDFMEHGMGDGSTPLIHALPGLRRMVSLERDPAWARCSACQADPSLTAMHRVSCTQAPHVDAVTAFLGDDLSSTLVLVDGPAAERIEVLAFACKHRAPFIIEHDCETLDAWSMELRLTLARDHGYVAFQHVALDPETLLLCKAGPPHPLDPTRFIPLGLPVPTS